MKKFGFFIALVFAKLALAHPINVNLNPEGTFKKVTATTLSGFTNRNECRAASGRWLGKGYCRFDNSGATVVIEKSPDLDIFNVVIENVNANGHVCSFEAPATFKNQVQLYAESNLCQVTVGFTSPNTLAVWTAGECDCGENVSLNIDNAKRAQVLKKK